MKAQRSELENRDNDMGSNKYIEMDAAFLLTVGSFLLTAELFCLQLYLGAFCLQFEHFYLQLELFCSQLSFCAYSGRVCRRSTSTDCKHFRGSFLEPFKLFLGGIWFPLSLRNPCCWGKTHPRSPFKWLQEGRPKMQFSWSKKKPLPKKNHNLDSR